VGVLVGLLNMIPVSICNINQIEPGSVQIMNWGRVRKPKGIHQLFCMK